MNTFERELSVPNLIHMLSVKKDTDVFQLNSGDFVEIKRSFHNEATYFDGPAMVLIVRQKTEDR